MSRVIAYVTEEVARQGHDVFSLDGIERVAWMLEAWAWMLEEASVGNKPTMMTIELIGKMVERDKNKNGFRKCGVRVGDRVCPPWQEVRGRVKALADNICDATKPLDFYREFEGIHPFVDGNGRTGKILLNWLNGTLLDPIFPPNDFWGEEIRNP